MSRALSANIRHAGQLPRSFMVSATRVTGLWAVDGEEESVVVQRQWAHEQPNCLISHRHHDSPLYITRGPSLIPPTVLEIEDGILRGFDRGAVFFPRLNLTPVVQIEGRMAENLQHNILPFSQKSHSAQLLLRPRVLEGIPRRNARRLPTVCCAGVGQPPWLSGRG